MSPILALGSKGTKCCKSPMHWHIELKFWELFYNVPTHLCAKFGAGIYYIEGDIGYFVTQEISLPVIYTVKFAKLKCCIKSFSGNFYDNFLWSKTLPQRGLSPQKVWYILFSCVRSGEFSKIEFRIFKKVKAASRTRL